jgi:uncharacterized membrane protein YdfJ with MMPL/SSD domain
VSLRPWIHRLIMPPAARNPFVKGFLDLPKLFIRYFSLLYLLALLRVSSRFTKIGGGFRRLYGEQCGKGQKLEKVHTGFKRDSPGKIIAHPDNGVQLDGFTVEVHRAEFSGGKVTEGHEEHEGFDPFYDLFPGYLSASQLTDVVDDVYDIIDDVTDIVGDVADIIDDVTDIVDDVADIIDDVTGIIDDVTDIVDDVYDIIDDVTDIVDDVTEVVDGRRGHH